MIQSNSLRWSLRTALILLGAALCGTATAATFTANGGVGSSLVGTGGDYPDLASAAEDFTTGPQAVTGNYTFLINSDTSETRQFTFGKPTNGFTVTVKPAAGKKPTVQFINTTQNNPNSTFNQTQGCPGSFIIGQTSLANTNTAIETGTTPTLGFTIDGSNTNGGTTKDLTFFMTGVVTQGGNTHFPNSRLIHITGSNNCVVKNCNIINTNDGSPSFGIYVTAVRTPVSNTVAATKVYPCDNVLITNNSITVNGVGSGTGVLVNSIFDGQANATGANEFPPGQAPNNYTITNNIVDARIRAIAVNLGQSGTISSNTLTAQNGSSAFGGVFSCGIGHTQSFGANGWTLNIFNNAIKQVNLSSATSGGIAGITLGVSTDPGSGTYNVYNNTISGMNDVGIAPGPKNGILARSPACVYNIKHNSINIADNTQGTPAAGDNVSAIAVTSTLRTTATTTLQNNLIRQDEHTGIGLDHASAVSVLTTNGNDVYTSTAATGYGRLAGTNYATLSAWQTATSQEGLGQTVDPAATTGSAWSSASATDLHFFPQNVIPTGINGGVATATTGITTDIDGQTRNSSAPLPGADEVIAGANVDGWSMY